MPAAAEATIHVRGYREIVKAFDKADRSINQEIQAAFKDVAEPIRAGAEARARASIPHLGPRWGLMRTGLTRTRVYVAPRERGKASRVNRRLARPNLAGLLLDRAMQPSLDANEGQVSARFDEALARIESIWDRA